MLNHTVSVEDEHKHLKCRVLSHRTGDYSVYAFENLDSECVNDKYLMCTKLPNWDIELNDGDTGILKFYKAIAGTTKWYDHRGSMTRIPHKHTAYYILDFVNLNNTIEIKKENNALVVN